MQLDKLQKIQGCNFLRHSIDADAELTAGDIGL